MNDRDYDENNNPDLGTQGTKTQGHGAMDKMAGKVEEGWGKLTNNESDVIKGKMKQGKGNVEEGVGKAERKTDDALDS
jgi:uncharacterized protein YjbJ (UPF0337 family)